VLENVERIVAIELVVAAQALELRLAMMPGAAPGHGVAAALERLRPRVRHLDADREAAPDLAAAAALVHDGVFADLADAGERAASSS
jgi:histidine ammonia-lyase